MESAIPSPEALPDIKGFDLRAPPQSFYDNPFPYYAALRQTAPIYQAPDGSLLLTRYQDIVDVYRNPAGFISDKREEYSAKYGDTPLFRHHTTSLVFNDEPLHTRVRRLIVGALSPKAVVLMQPGLEALVDRLLDQAEARGEIDLVEDFAAAIPVEVISNLLDVPRTERAPLRQWSLDILTALEPAPSPEMLESGNRAVEEFLTYLRSLITRRRAAMGNPDTDVLSRLIAGEADGERLSEQELLHNCIFILNAGHETTTNLIGNGLQLLIEWPQARADLLGDPTLINTAIEEFLRFESSNQLGNRRAALSTEISGRHVAAGALLTLCIGAANRDPEVFEHPDDLNIRRTPNKHLAFASGPHQCAGLNVARMEGRTAIARFIARFPNYQPIAPPVRGGRARFRGFKHIPVALR